MDDIVLQPVGIVKSEFTEPDHMPLGGAIAVIEIDPRYVPALKGLEENSHIWVLSWFHKAPRDVLRVVPAKVNPNLPEYGVFGLRSFARPNPIGMSLAELERIEGNLVYVRNLDAIGGTPVLDIKPYYENDIVFSPDTPYIKGKSREMRMALCLKQARTHHREECRELYAAVRMAVIAEEQLGKLNSNDLNVTVQGLPCLGDCIQGVTRARLSHPARFSYRYDASLCRTIWQKEERALTITLKDGIDLEALMQANDEAIMEVIIK